MIPARRAQLAQRPKAAAAPVVDDWEADEPDSDAEQPARKAQDDEDDDDAQALAAHLQASLRTAGRGDVTRALGQSRRVDDESRNVWTRANTSAPPAPQGVILLRPSDAAVGGVRVLPPASLLGAPAGLADGGVPKILRRSAAESASERDAAAAAAAAQRAAQQGAMTLEARERAYAEARARIFGTASGGASPAASDAGGSGGGDGASCERTAQGGRAKRSGGGSGGAGTGRRSRASGGGGGSGRTSGRNSPSGRAATPERSASAASATAAEAQHAPSREREREHARGADGPRQPLGPSDAAGAGFAPRR